MPPNQDANPTSTSVGGKVPAGVKTALVEWSHELNAEDPYTEVKQSHLIRQGLYEFILDHWEEAPEEVREQIDKEWLENQVENGLGVEL